MDDLKKNGETFSRSLPYWIKKHLSAKDVISIESRISDIERLTAGEFVLLITRKSFKWDLHYSTVTLIALLSFMLFFEDALDSWLGTQFFFTTAWAEVGIKLGVIISLFLFSFLISKTKLVYRLCTPTIILRRMAEARAELEFFRSGIKQTKAGTGILLYLAVEDRQAVVLADKAISDKLPPETWDGMLNQVLDGIKSNKFEEGILRAIDMSGAILKEHFPIGPSDVNELKNFVIFKD